MPDIDTKQVHQLLLSPLFLLNHILGVTAPGALLMLMLAFKGNTTLRVAWLYSPFGYKTKVTIFLLLAYFFGSVLRAFAMCVMSVLTKNPAPPEMSSWVKEQTPEIQKMLIAMATDGVLMSTPGLIDRLSVIQADGGFHIGTGMALLVAAFIPGDGHLRWLEAIFGLLMFSAGVLKGRKYNEEVLGMIGVGWANLLGRMTPQQIQIASAVINSMKPKDATPKVVIDTPAVGPEA